MYVWKRSEGKRESQIYIWCLWERGVYSMEDKGYSAKLVPLARRSSSSWMSTRCRFCPPDTWRTCRDHEPLASVLLQMNLSYLDTAQLGLVFWNPSFCVAWSLKGREWCSVETNVPTNRHRSRKSLQTINNPRNQIQSASPVLGICCQENNISRHLLWFGERLCAPVFSFSFGSDSEGGRVERAKTRKTSCFWFMPQISWRISSSFKDMHTPSPMEHSYIGVCSTTNIHHLQYNQHLWVKVF